MSISNPSSEDDQIYRTGIGASTSAPYRSSPQRPISPSSSDSQLSSASEDLQEHKSGLPSAFGGAKARVRKRRRIQSHSFTNTPAKQKTADQAGDWERHTRGIGSKILAKHGFTGRLGKRGEGIAAPIQPIFRPEKLGLGAGAFSEKGEAAEVEEAVTKRDKETEHLTHQRSKQYQPRTESAFEKVIDMREALPRELNSVDALVQSHQKPTGTEKTDMRDRLFAAPEVLYNLQMLTHNARAEVGKAERRRDTERLIARTAQREVQKRGLEKENAKQAVSCISEMEMLFDTLVGTPQTTDEKVFETCVKQVVGMQRVAAQKSFFSSQLVQAALTEVVSERIEQQMQVCLLKCVEQGKADKKLVRHMYKILTEVRNAVDPIVYTKLCTRSILAPLRSHLSRPAWDVVRGASVGDVLSWMRRILPEALLTVFAEEVLVPRLLSRLKLQHESTLIGGTAEVPAHVWIHPWLPATGRRSLVEVLHRVRVTLSKSLQEWKPGGSAESRTELVDVVRSWSKVLSRRKLQLALSRHITPKLGHRLLHTTQGDLDEPIARVTLEEIAAWSDVGSVRLLAKDLTNPFLGGPGALIQKVALADGNWTRAKNIYLFWTQTLPPRLKRYMQPVLAALLFVLHAAQVTTDPSMIRRLEHADLSPLLKNVFESRRVEDSRREAIQSEDTGRVREARKARLVDVLEMVGKREGLVVVGLGEERGMRVFQMGSARVVVDVERNVFIVKGRAVDVDEIIRLAKSG